jgi:hypothetical protein
VTREIEKVTYTVGSDLDVAKDARLGTVALSLVLGPVLVDIVCAQRDGPGNVRESQFSVVNTISDMHRRTRQLDKHKLGDTGSGGGGGLHLQSIEPL